MKRLSILFFVVLCCRSLPAQNKIIVFQSDFGQKDGAVSAMKGVAASVSADIRMYDLTHEIPAYNIWEASYRLDQTVRYWPAGTVFVSVVDPGVGTARKSVVLKTKTGHFIVTPDNGTLTHTTRSLGIDTLREIDESVNRRNDSRQSYTFHGRDVYAFTGARLAAGAISFEQVGQALPPHVVSLPFQEPVIRNGIISGGIPILDVQYGNVWTNIPSTMIAQLHLTAGQTLRVAIFRNGRKVYGGVIPFHETFGSVARGKTLAYLNSLMQLSFAVNEGDFSRKYRVNSGNEWRVEVSRAE